MAEIKVIDVSKWNNLDKAQLEHIAHGGVEGMFVQLTVGTDSQYDNPKASLFVDWGLKTFKFTGAYHYYYGGGKAEAEHFISRVESFGLDKTTPLMADVEDNLLYGNHNADVQEFIDYCYAKGYKNLWVYCGNNNAVEGMINPNKINHAKSWIASYGTKPTVTYYAWQYTDSYNGLSLDCSIFNTKDILDDEQSAKAFDGYEQPNINGKFEVITNHVNVYRDEHLKVPHGVQFTKGSTFYGKTFVDGKVTRIQTSMGYVSANTSFTKLIKTI